MRCPNKQRELYKNNLEIIIKNRIKRDIEANYPDDYIKGYYPLLEKKEFTIYDAQISATAMFKTMVGIGNHLYYGQNYQELGKVTKVISNNRLNVTNLTLKNEDHNYQLYIKIDDYIFNMVNIGDEKQTITKGMEGYDAMKEKEYHTKCCSCKDHNGKHYSNNSPPVVVPK